MCTGGGLLLLSRVGGTLLPQLPALSSREWDAIRAVVLMASPSCGFKVHVACLAFQLACCPVQIN